MGYLQFVIFIWLALMPFVFAFYWGASRAEVDDEENWAYVGLTYRQKQLRCFGLATWGALLWPVLTLIGLAVCVYEFVQDRIADEGSPPKWRGRD